MIEQESAALPESTAAYWKALGEGFVKKLAESIFVITILAGIGLIAASRIIPSPHSEISWQKVLFSIGETLLASGAMAAVLKSFVFTKIFRSAIQDLFDSKMKDLTREIESVFLQDKVLQERKDLPRLSAKIPKLIHGDGYHAWPRNWGDIVDIICEQYFSSQVDRYYTEYFCEVKIKEFDEASMRIVLEENMSMNIIPTRKNRVVDYECWFKTENHEASEMVATRQITSLTIDGKAYTPHEIEESISIANGEKPEVLGKIKTSQRLKKKLEGKGHYPLRRTSIKQFYLSRDPVTTTIFNSYLKNCTVRCIQGHPKLLVDFGKFGTFGDFSDTGQCKCQTDKKGLGEVVYKDWILPGQGFILSFVRL